MNDIFTKPKKHWRDQLASIGKRSMALFSARTAKVSPSEQLLPKNAPTDRGKLQRPRSNALKIGGRKTEKTLSRQSTFGTTGPNSVFGDKYRPKSEGRAAEDEAKSAQFEITPRFDERFLTEDARKSQHRGGTGEVFVGRDAHNVPCYVNDAEFAKLHGGKVTSEFGKSVQDHIKQVNFDQLYEDHRTSVDTTFKGPKIAISSVGHKENGRENEPRATLRYPEGVQQSAPTQGELVLCNGYQFHVVPKPHFAHMSVGQLRSRLIPGEMFVGKDAKNQPCYLVGPRIPEILGIKDIRETATALEKRVGEIDIVSRIEKNQRKPKEQRRNQTSLGTDNSRDRALKRSNTR